MKKLGLFLGLIVSLFLLSSLPAFAQNSYPAAKGFVNDFASIIPDNVEQQLEATLRDYAQKTTNEIAVVTTQSLGGLSIEEYTIGLAEKWKVGKKGKDNGVILLVAPNEKKVRVEVGYGLEHVLTDAKAKLIIEKMTPYFKNSDYAGGIKVGVQGITDTIGYLAPEEIEQQRKEKEAKDQAVTAVFLGVLMYVGIFIAFFILVVVLCRSISAWQKEKRRKEKVRREVLEDIKVLESSLERITADIQRLAGDNGQYPAAMAKEWTDLTARNIDLGNKVKDILQGVQKLLKKDPELARLEVAKAQESVGYFQDVIRACGAKQNAFDNARLCYGEKIKEADLAIKDTFVYLTGLKEKRYVVAPDQESAPARQEVEMARGILSEGSGVPDYRAVINHAEWAARKAQAVKDRWEKRLSLERANAEKLSQLSVWFGQFFQPLKTTCEADLEALKAKAPPEVWEPIDKDIKQKEALAEAEFGNLFNAATRLNGKDKQEFEAAAKTIEKMNNLKKDVELSLGQPRATLQSFAEAQKKVKTAMLQAVNAIKQAKDSVSNSDAGGAGRDKLQAAKGQLARAVNLEKSDLPNWILVTGLLAGAIALAQVAEQEARDRVAEAERVRRRQREEKEREERRRRDDDYYHSSPSWSSGSSSSSSSGGFGGFGGGSFGGGGASGSW